MVTAAEKVAELVKSTGTTSPIEDMAPVHESEGESQSDVVESREETK